MAETVNTARLAEIVSSEIFRWLKWGVKPLRDINWKCVEEKHEKSTHPSDVVFYYNHPYSGKMIYINTDLKSYKSTSISERGVRSDLKSLAMAIECALISDDWQHRYTHDSQPFDVLGLLFIFNYDGSFLKDFNKTFLSKISLESIGIPKNQQLAIFDPATINYLINLVDDLRIVVQNNNATNQDSYDFFYPDLVMNKKHSLGTYSATIEYILSPYMMVKFNNDYDHHYIVYYKEAGDTVEEFIYLIDTLSTFQMLNPENKIDIVLYNPNDSKTALVNFTNAKTNYANSWGMKDTDPHFMKLTARIMVKKVNYYDPLNQRLTDEQY